ncbi:class II fructose-bisphosphatase [Selenomonadales bacterium OttesenSCG-928-I06]|nr:class II fructose-bisphosphatase [Selenomonadales bacterium OttesenSCG-928-I06]
MDRQLALEFVRVTEAAAISAARFMGKGDKIGADQAAVDAMRKAFNKVRVSGKVVIGEGEMDEAPMLYIGEVVGRGGEGVDIAVDPVEGTTLVAKGMPGALAVLAIAPTGCLLNAPDMYMDKIAVGSRARGKIDINAPVTENLKNVAKAMDRHVNELTVIILDRDRHIPIINEIREAGARIKLINDGDVSPALSIAVEGTSVHMLLGVGGAPEGVLAAAALKCLGGDMQARLIPEGPEDIIRAKKMGIDDINKVLYMDDLVKGSDIFFAATAITSCDLLDEVRYFPGGARTNSIVVRGTSATIRFIDAIHRLENEPLHSIKL